MCKISFCKSAQGDSTGVALSRVQTCQENSGQQHHEKFSRGWEDVLWALVFFSSRQGRQAAWAIGHMYLWGFSSP